MNSIIERIDCILFVGWYIEHVGHVKHVGHVGYTVLSLWIFTTIFQLSKAFKIDSFGPPCVEMRHN